LVFQHAPLPTSPVDGGGAATPSPPAGRVGVGAMFKSHCKDTYYVRSDLEETEALIRCIREVNYVYWRSGKRAINLRDYVKEQTSEETSANKARR